MNNEGTVSFDAGDNPEFKESVAGKSLGIPTAEEFAVQNGFPRELFKNSQYTKLMIAFAINHKNAALQQAFNNAEMKECTKDDEQICWVADDYGDAWVLDKDSIINSYPDSLIK